MPDEPLKLDPDQFSDLFKSINQLSHISLRTARMQIASQMAMTQNYGSHGQLAELYNKFLKALSSNSKDLMDENL